MHERARQWDKRHRKHKKNPDYWLWDKALGCAIPNARPCSYCGQVTVGGAYLCDPCADLWFVKFGLRTMASTLLVGACMLNVPNWKSSDTRGGE